MDEQRESMGRIEVAHFTPNLRSIRRGIKQCNAANTRTTSQQRMPGIFGSVAAGCDCTDACHHHALINAADFSII